jgi:hypothetical protein
MYEIWLMLNIAWEMADPLWPLLGAGALLWAVLVAVARRRPRADWRRAMPWAVAVGAGAALLVFLGAPGATQSSLAEMGYWVDWATLLGIAAAGGTTAAAFAWPIAAMRGRRGSGRAA